jgi:hypothetical protein
MKDAPEEGKELPSPKRGAFPSPKAEIDKAKPYVPNRCGTSDQQHDELPPGVDPKRPTRK